MPVLSAIQLTLADDKAENEFLSSFTKALEYTGAIPGLIRLTAWKQVGAERTYLAFTEWEDEASIEAWLRGEREQKNIAMAKNHLCVSTRASRWQLIKENPWQK